MLFLFKRFKKPSLTGPAVFDALSNKKKIFDFIYYYG